MPAEYWKKSGQIPAFGDWENANELPITQYFECARQAGLLRCSCSGECGGSYMNNAASWGGGGGGGGGGGDLYAVGFDRSLPRRVYAVPQRKTSKIDKGYSHSGDQRKQAKVRELMDHQPRNHQPAAQKHYSKHSNKSRDLVAQKSSISVKPVDEDLYKIPSELLENSKRKKQKKMLGFFSRCMAPPCAA